MLAKTKITRHRTRVDEITDDGKIHCHIYPTLTSKECFRLNADIESSNLDAAKLTVGAAFDLLLMDNNQVMAIEKPQIHPFDIKTLYSQGLDCITATINQAAEGIYGAATAKRTINGEEKIFRIDSLTLMFQAQADEELRDSILRRLKPGDSVVVRADLDGPLIQTGEVEAVNAIHAKYLTVNYR